MSGADDRPPCAECGDTWGAGVHDYAHPYKAPQPAPSGNDAKVRASVPDLMMISDEDGKCFRCRVLLGENAECRLCLIYAAGKADGARAASAGCYCKTRQFRVMDAPTGCPQLVPWWLLAPFEPQARENHEQSLERLDARGGLAPSEILAVVEGRRFRRMDDADAGRQLAIVVADAIARRGSEGT